MILQKLHKINMEIDAISKSSKGVHGACRSVYDIYRVIHPLLAENGVVMRIAAINDKSITWAFVDCEDQSEMLTVIPNRTNGEQHYDAGKDVSYTAKYAIISTFTIPDQEVNQHDPDITGYPNQPTTKQAKPLAKPQSKPNTVPRGLTPEQVDQNYKHQVVSAILDKLPVANPEMAKWIVDQLASPENLKGKSFQAWFKGNKKEDNQDMIDLLAKEYLATHDNEVKKNDFPEVQNETV